MVCFRPKGIRQGCGTEVLGNIMALKSQETLKESKVEIPRYNIEIGIL